VFNFAVAKMSYVLNWVPLIEILNRTL